MRKLQVVVTEDSEQHAGLQERIEQVEEMHRHPMYGDPLPLEIESLVIKKTGVQQEINFFRDWRKEHPLDFLILNHRSSDPLAFVRSIRKEKTLTSPLPIVVTASINSGESNELQNLEIPMWKDHNRRETNANQQLYNIIRKHAFKPLNIGIAGFGRYGFELRRLLESADFVGELPWYSRHFDMNNGKHIGELLESCTNSQVGSLEELCARSDCIVIAISALYGKSPLAKNPDRSDLFLHERDLIAEYAEEIRRTSYQGLVIMITNPVGENLNLFSRISNKTKSTRVVPTQFTSPFNRDIERAIHGIISCAHRSIEPEKIAWIVDLIKRYMIGIHGKPEVMIPACAPLQDKLSELEFALIRDAEEYASILPERAMKTSIRMQYPYLRVQQSATDFLENIAHFRKPATAEYCYISSAALDVPEESTIQGYLALPVQNMFYANRRIHLLPDEDHVRSLVRSDREKLRGLLEIQNKHVKNYNTGKMSA